MKSAVVLVHLGTPENATPQAVRAFLKTFLSDPRVVEIPRLLWMLILHGVILPFRPRKVAKAYAELWHKWGDSPLRIYAQALETKLGGRIRQCMGDANDALHQHDIEVVTAMSYSDKRINDVIDDCMQRGVDKLIVIPMYPQYSATTTAAVYDQIGAHSQRLRVVPDVRIVREFYQHSLYRRALADSVRDFWRANGRGECLLMSFHGIPQANVDKGDPYASHCEFTAKSLAEDLALNDTQWAISYQSRLGRAQWLQPYTMQMVEKLAQRGVETLDVVCPAFSLDCIETLEEIALQIRDAFVASGGKSLRLIPCLNDRDDHVEMLVDIVRRTQASFI